MTTKPAYVASDAHLGAVPREREIAFASWLRFAGERASRIVLNGDVFDFWFEYRHAVPRGHARVLGALAEVVDAGVPVTFLGGNHDWWGGSYLTDEIGVEFHRDPVRLQLAGRAAYVAHGDGLGKGDLGYRMMRLLLRGRLTCWAFRWLHPDIGGWVADLVSQSEHRDGPPDEGDKGRARVLEAWALKKLAEDTGIDLVILGHTHIPTVTDLGGRFYINAGDWIRYNSYAVIETSGPPRIEYWSEDGPLPGSPRDGDEEKAGARV